MKRYWLFAGEDFYPAGGISDFIDSYEDLPAAQAAAAGDPINDWWHIVDTRDGVVIASNRGGRIDPEDFPVLIKP